MPKTTIADLIKTGVLALGDGYRTKQSELRSSGFRIIRVADVRGGQIALDSPDFVSHEFARQIGAKAARADDVLLTTKGTVGRVAIVPDLGERAVYSPQLCWFRVHDREYLDPRFLSYWLLSAEFTSQASHLQSNTDMAPYISLSDLRKSKITLPERREQQAIAEVLGALDEKIAANTALTSAAEALATNHLQRVRSFVPLSELANIDRTAVNPASLGDEVVEHFSLPAFDRDQTAVTEAASAIKSNKFQISEPVVLLSKLNPRFPRVWRAGAAPGRRALASTEFLMLVPRGISRELLWTALAQPSFANALGAKVAGTSGSHQRVKPKDALMTPVLDPRMLEEPATRAVHAALLLASAVRKENRTLATTRDALLPQLMSGKLRVRDAEAAASAAGA